MDRPFKVGDVVIATRNLSGVVLEGTEGIVVSVPDNRSSCVGVRFSRNTLDRNIECSYILDYETRLKHSDFYDKIKDRMGKNK